VRLLPFVSWGLRLFPQRACPTTSSGFGMVDKGFFRFGGGSMFVSGCVCSQTDLICEVIRQCVFLICLGIDRSDMRLELTEVVY
jgi:hypothetical protein